MAVSLPSSDGVHSVSQIRIQSSYADGTLTYSATNDGDVPLHMYINLGKSEKLDGQFFDSLEEPMQLDAGKGAEIAVRAEGSVRADSATVVVWDRTMKLAAIGTAGVYETSGQSKPLATSEIWDLVVGDRQ